MRTLVVALLLTAPFAAGCLSAEGEPAEAARAGGGEPLETTGGTPNPLESNESEAPPAPVTTALAYEGTTATEACGWLPVANQGVCVGPGSATNRFVDFEAPGTLTRLTAEIAWTAATPIAANFHVMLIVDGETEEEIPMVTGTSPIVIDWDLTPFAGIPLGLFVDSAFWHGVDGVAYTGVAAGQSFSVNGTITSLPG